MHYFSKAEFVKSCDSIENIPEKRLKEVIFVGKSNVGKSSLINALVNQKKLAYTSSTPGHTKLLNYYLIENKFYFVDFPGYGFSKNKGQDYKFYAKVIGDYFENNEYLKLVVFLLDSRHLPTDDDLDFYNFIKSMPYNFVFALTKCDKLNMSEKAKIVKNLHEKFGDFNEKKIILTSINKPEFISNLKTIIENCVD